MFIGIMRKEINAKNTCVSVYHILFHIGVFLFNFMLWLLNLYLCYVCNFICTYAKIYNANLNGKRYSINIVAIYYV